jgi:ADP-ribose pyrophosphatase YjhB (NUDIX family)
MTEGPRIRVAGLVLAEERILLARQEKHGASYWLLPGGGVEEGEALTDALVRELREECGLVAGAINGPIALAETIPPDGTSGRHILHVVFHVETEAVPTSPTDADAAVLALRLTPRRDVRGVDLRPPMYDFLETYRPGDPFVSLGRLWSDERGPTD